MSDCSDREGATRYVSKREIAALRAHAAHDKYVYENSRAEAAGDFITAVEVIAAHKARIKELERLLDEAAGEIEDWGQYASQYFQDKHDLAGTVAMYRGAAQQEVGDE